MVLVFQFQKATNWLGKKLTLRETAWPPSFFKRLKLKWKKVYTLLGLQIRSEDEQLMTIGQGVWR